MWLRDSLPYDIIRADTDDPMARVMIYGYESKVAQSESMQNLEDLATSFHNSLLALASAPTTKPIILIAHSLGGLIIKQALISLSRSRNEDAVKLVRAVYGIVFFGVPHDGMDISSLIPMVNNGPNRFLVESIGSINSQILSIQQREFHTALGGEGDSEVFCFYEMVESPTAQKDEYGNWAMTGPAAVLVTKSSATHCRSWEDGPEHICAVARTHSNMVKFRPRDHEYDKARERLKGLARRALSARRGTQASNAKFLVPYNQNPDFVGRSGILEDLERQLGCGQRQGAVKSRSRVSLYGLGGVGKTQIALAYVYWLQEMCPDVSVFWVHASNAERFRQAYSSIAQECGIPGYDDPKADVLSLVKTWLEKTYRSRWLMVIDNADDTQLFFLSQQERDDTNPSNIATKAEGSLGRYIPECSHGSILITSRNKQTASRLAPGKSLIEVGKMTEHEADQLVRAILEDDEISSEETSLLATRLEHLPLALVQATAFIQENTISIGEYIQLLDESDSALVDRLSEPFEAVGRDSDTPHAVTATWIISFEQIERRHAFASDILSLISLLDRQAIPKDFAADYCHRTLPKESEISEAAELTKALGTLKAFSFISKGKDQTVDMHRLVQLVTRKWLVIKSRMAEFAQHALEIVSAAYPYGRFESREICLRYLPHAHAVLENNGTGSRIENIARASLLHCVAGHFLYQGQWKDACHISGYRILQL
ncbi:P-loop containing nucleoside triphosphate hydrolase protein [Dactylonectria macrodidyma]|uniref:P-loop containing nucleoside triphosphate hydrolase protein n=1 Tax=Dactylonectria macrodidyma TaxID=307937 RepID=A0A9P9I6L6_9HYPO|nr:P-loop containing nucleoside triphosphate hydrolase protein [Dactylonectria macrodidyma]